VLVSSSCIVDSECMALCSHTDVLSARRSYHTTVMRAPCHAHQEHSEQSQVVPLMISADRENMIGSSCPWPNTYSRNWGTDGLHVTNLLSPASQGGGTSVETP
jgi:hypothetical protein